MFHYKRLFKPPVWVLLVLSGALLTTAAGCGFDESPADRSLGVRTSALDESSVLYGTLLDQSLDLSSCQSFVASIDKANILNAANEGSMEFGNCTYGSDCKNTCGEENYPVWYDDNDNGVPDPGEAFHVWQRRNAIFVTFGGEPDARGVVGILGVVGPSDRSATAASSLLASCFIRHGNGNGGDVETTKWTVDSTGWDCRASAGCTTYCIWNQ